MTVPEGEGELRKCEQCGNMVKHGDYKYWWKKGDEELDDGNYVPWICLECNHNNNWSGYWD